MSVEEREGGSSGSKAGLLRDRGSGSQWVVEIFDDEIPVGEGADGPLRRMASLQFEDLATIRVHGKIKTVCRRSLFLFPLEGVVRQSVLLLVEWRGFDRFILFCIFLNSVMLGMYQYRATPDEDHWWINEIQNTVVESVLLAVFGLESGLKIIAWGFVMDKRSYLRDAWNVLDFVVVISGLLDVIGLGGSIGFLRLFRLLRPLRSLNSVPQLKILVSAALGSILRLGNVVVLGMFLFTVFGIVGIQLMPGIFYHQCRTTKDPILINGCWSWNSTGEDRLCGGNYECEDGGFCRGHDGDWDEAFRPIFAGGRRDFPWCEEPVKLFPETDFVHFDHIGGAFLLIFQSMTLEGWIELMYMVEDSFNPWFACIFFVAIVIFTNFFLLNVALAVVDEVQDAKREEEEGEEEKLEEAARRDTVLSSLLPAEEDIEDSPTRVDESADPLRAGAYAKSADAPEFALLKDGRADVEEEMPSVPRDSIDTSNAPQSEVGDDWCSCALVRWCQCIAANSLFQNFIMLAITGNVVNMCLLRFSLTGAFGWNQLNDIIDILELIFLCIFIVEMFIMITALGPLGYVRNKVTAFDGFVVVSSVVELVVSLANDGKGSSGLSALRTFRLFRMMNKLASKWPRLRCLLKAVVRTANALKDWLVLFGLMLYIFTLICMNSFARQFRFDDVDALDPLVPAEDWDVEWCPQPYHGTTWNFRQDCIPRAHFDTFTWGMVTVFQVMTGENWNTIMYAGMRASSRWTETFGIPPTVISAGVFIIMILFGQTLFMSLFLSMLISKFDEVQDEYKKQEEELSRQKKAKHHHAKVQAFNVSTAFARLKLGFRGAGESSLTSSSSLTLSREARSTSTKSRGEKSAGPTKLQGDLARGREEKPRESATSRGCWDKPPRLPTQKTDVEGVKSVVKVEGNPQVTTLPGQLPYTPPVAEPLEPAAFEFTVHIKKATGEQLGCTYQHPITGSRVVVKEIKENGTLDVWNRANPTELVKEEDCVIAANGVQGNAARIIDEMEASASLSLVIQRGERRPNGKSSTSSESVVDSSADTNHSTRVVDCIYPEISPVTMVDVKSPGRIVHTEPVSLPGQLPDAVAAESRGCGIGGKEESLPIQEATDDPESTTMGSKGQQPLADGPEETDIDELPGEDDEDDNDQQVETVSPRRKGWPHSYALLVLSEENPVRQAALNLLNQRVTWADDKFLIFDNFILVCILLSTLCMMADTPLSNPEDLFVQVLRTTDTIFSVIFIVEMAVKLIAHGLMCGPNAYLTNGWNWLDGTVVVVSIIDLLPLDDAGGAGFLRVLRILRTFRPLRIISRWQGLRVVVQAIFQSIGDLASLTIMASLFLLIFALMFLMYLKGTLYMCTPGAHPVGYLGPEFGSLGDDFTTPLCLPVADVTLGSSARGVFAAAPEGGGSWQEGSCDGTGDAPRPVEWRRPSADTPICLARCDPTLESHPGIEELCHRKYTIPEELPSVCEDSSRISLFPMEEAVGHRYIQDMQRTLVVPCGGVTLADDDGLLVNVAGAVSCKSNFCPDVGDPSESCVDECRSHQFFCADTCTDPDDNSLKCAACRRECEAACACEDFCTPLIKDAALCHEQGGDWGQVLSQNFDMIVSSLLTLFEISTTEGWVDVMYAAADAVDVYRQPIRDFAPGIYVIFFPLWIVVSNFFVLNLVVGVIVDNFMSARSNSQWMVTGPQEKWILHAQQKWVKSRLTLHSLPFFFDLENLHLLGPFRRKLYDLISSKLFDHFIMASIIMNTVIMAATMFPVPEPFQEWLDFQELANYVFAGIFTVEAVLKLLALRANYWLSAWNRFDFLCVASTLIGILLKHPPFNLNLGAATSVIRILRIARLFRLLRFLKELDRLFRCLLRAIPKLFNVLLILVLFLVLFSVLGMSLFGTAKFGESYNEHGNFRTFFRGFVTLLRASTGEAWNEIMHDLAKDERTYFQEGSWCSPQSLFKSRDSETYKVLDHKCLIESPNACPGSWNPLPAVFWVMFTVLITFMILNLVVAVILEGYEEGRGVSESDEVEICIEIWKKYDPDHKMAVPLKDGLPFINEATRALQDKVARDGGSKMSERMNAMLAAPAAPEAEDISGLCGKLSLREWKGKWSMNVTPDNKVTLLSASRQVFRLNSALLMEEKDIKEQVLDKSDAHLSRREREKLARMERAFLEHSLHQDLMANIAAMKLQRQFRRRKARREATLGRQQGPSAS